VCDWWKAEEGERREKERERNEYIERKHRKFWLFYI
jgi:hypothetical protein